MTVLADADTDQVDGASEATSDRTKITTRHSAVQCSC